MPAKGMKTVSVAATMLLAVLSSTEVQNVIATYPKSFGSFMAVLIVVLRVVTTTPIFSKEASPEDCPPETAPEQPK